MRITARCSVGLLALLASSSIFAQNRTAVSTAAVPAANENSALPRAVPCFGVREWQPEKQLEENAIAMLPEWDRRWLTEDVVDLISPPEHCAFLHLLTDQERRQFVESFWTRRSPDPTSLDNAFKREHYERIVFANERFGGQIPGWKTDRGRIYVRLGAPDSIEAHRAGKTDSDTAAGAVEKHPYPSEVWHYNLLHGKAVNLEFVDPGGTGDYRLVLPPELKNEPVFVSNYDLTGAENPWGDSDSEAIAESPSGLQTAPIVHFKDLEACVTSGLERDQVHFAHRIEFFKTTDATTLTRIVVRLPDAQTAIPEADTSSPVAFEVFARISEPSGWIAETFERKISFDGQSDPPQNPPDFPFEAALAPGTYRLAIVVKNVDTGDVGTLRETIEVPSYETLNSAQSFR